MVGIYKITNPKGRVYIGQSVDIERRKSSYSAGKCKGQPRLYSSLMKYGFDNHLFEVLEECEETCLNTRERYYQDLYEVTGTKGLNCKLQSTQELPQRLSEEVIDKIRFKLKGRPCNHSPEGLERIRQNGKRERSLEEREKLRESLTGKSKSKSHRENISKSTRGVNNHNFKVITVDQEELLSSLLKQGKFKKDIKKVLGVSLQVLNRWIKDLENK